MNDPEERTGTSDSHDVDDGHDGVNPSHGQPTGGEHVRPLGPVYDVPAVYLRDGRYVAAEYDGPDGLVCMVAGESNADDLAAKFNQDLEGSEMAAKGTKKAKGEKKARVAKAPKVKVEKAAKERDPRLPAPGTMIRKMYKGKEYEIRINEADCTYDGDRMSLSDAVKKITKWEFQPNPYQFFKKVFAEKNGTAA